MDAAVTALGVRQRRWRADIAFMNPTDESLRSTARRITKDKRQARCGLDAVRKRLLIGERDGKPVTLGIGTCGRLACPSCSDKRHRTRRAQIGADLSGSLATGHTTLFVTLAPPHSRGDNPYEVFERLQQGRGNVLSGGFRATHLNEAWGLVAVDPTTQVTYETSGCHPHDHLLLYFDRHLSDADIDAVKKRLTERFIEKARRPGASARATRAAAKHAVDVQRFTAMEGLDTYLALPTVTNGQATGMHQHLARIHECHQHHPDVFMCRACAPLIAQWREYERLIAGRQMSSAARLPRNATSPESAEMTPVAEVHTEGWKRVRRHGMGERFAEQVVTGGVIDHRGVRAGRRILYDCLRADGVPAGTAAFAASRWVLSAAPPTAEAAARRLAAIDLSAEPTLHVTFGPLRTPPPALAPVGASGWRRVVQTALRQLGLRRRSTAPSKPAANGRSAVVAEMVRHIVANPHAIGHPSR
jgi:hypothetical protein